MRLRCSQVSIRLTCRRPRIDHILGEFIGIGCQCRQRCVDGLCVMGLEGVGDLGVEAYDLFAGPRREGDHIHQWLHRLDGACELVGNDGIICGIDQRAVEGDVGGAEGLVGQAWLGLAVGFGAHGGEVVGRAARGG